MVLWALFGVVVVNAALWMIYHNRTYPRTTMGTMHVGNMPFDKVQTEEQQTKTTQTISINAGTKQASIGLQDAGAHFDAARTKASLTAGRSWLPIVAVFTRHTVAVPVAFDDVQLAAIATRTSSAFHIDPVPAKVILNQTHFSVADAQKGYDLDKNKLGDALLRALDNGKAAVAAPLITKAAIGPTKSELQITAQKLEKTLASSLTYTYGSNSHKASRNDIAGLYKASGTGYVLDDFTVRTYIATTGTQMGVHPKDLSAAVETTKQTVANGGTVSVVLQPFATTKTYRYCVSSRGADAAAQVPELKKKLASTYTDLRGWTLDGQVQFVYVTSGCDFTVWLASSNQMSTFGAICDPVWNCEVDNNVVVNLDRWLQTSDSWRAYGGSVEDYRDLLINHETGHMLGFHHLTCPGKGQPAPVMMQQSIDLQGCVFNVWPTPAEFAMLRSMIGL